MQDWVIFQWLHFFDIMDWWKWPLAFLLGCTFMAIISVSILCLKWELRKLNEYLDKIFGDKDDL